MVKPYGSALEEITEQEVEMLVLEYWHHHQTVLSGDGQPDFLAQVRRVRANTSTASSRQGFVWGMGHVSDTETGLIYMRARYYDPGVGRMAKGTPRRLPRPRIPGTVDYVRTDTFGRRGSAPQRAGAERAANDIPERLCCINAPVVQPRIIYAKRHNKTVKYMCISNPVFSLAPPVVVALRSRVVEGLSPSSLAFQGRV